MTETEDGDSKDSKDSKDEEREEVLRGLASDFKEMDHVSRSWVYRGASGDLQMVVGCDTEEIPDDISQLAEANGLRHVKSEPVKETYDHIFLDMESGREEREKEREYFREIKDDWGLESIAIGRFGELYDRLGIDTSYVNPSVVDSDFEGGYVAEFEYEDRMVLQFTPDPAERRDLGGVFVSEEGGGFEDYEELLNLYIKIVYTELTGEKECSECGRVFDIDSVEAASLGDRLDRWSEDWCGCEN